MGKRVTTTRRNIRDLARTRERILKAALAEFSARGFAGARTERIARRARVNKRMLFYCFGSKRALHAEVLRRKIADKAEAIASTPEDLAAALKYWAEIGTGDGDWIRMHEWEALEPGAWPTVARAERRRLFVSVHTRLRRAQLAGAVAPGVNLEQLFLSVIALSAFPAAFPQFTRLITGFGPRHPRFRRARARFLGWLGARMAAVAPRPLRKRRKPG
ncbi:MAG TPA: TetR family transcriptional regulator [Candidatus Binataceae bacterium]|nr:TetR family transcriptional regulator [Candidatus Binataceae bacterium]